VRRTSAMLMSPLCCSDAPSTANWSARHCPLRVTLFPTAISGPKSQGAIDTQPSTTQAFKRVNAMIGWTGHLPPRATSASARRRRLPCKANFDFVQPQAVHEGSGITSHLQPPACTLYHSQEGPTPREQCSVWVRFHVIAQPGHLPCTSLHRVLTYYLFGKLTIYLGLV
jgi:hypothetical protein